MSESDKSINITASEDMVAAEPNTSSELDTHKNRARRLIEAARHITSEHELIAICPAPDDDCLVCIFGAPFSFERLDCPMLNAILYLDE